MMGFPFFRAALLALLLAGVQRGAPQAQQPPAGPVIPPTPADFAAAPRTAAATWPSFRGPGASGVADGQGAPVQWDIAASQNIRWKTPIPGAANASPVVWGNRVFITTAVSATGPNSFSAGTRGGVAPLNDLSEHSWKLYALDTQSGRIVWEKEVHKSAPLTKRHPKGSQAASTPVTDGTRVVVLFGTVGVFAAYDVNGGLLWKNDLGLIDSGYVQDPTQQWGHSSSPIIYQDSVILQVDRQKDSYVAAYNLSTGKELWKTAREDEISTWGTPTIAKGKLGDELVTNGTKIRGYDPKTGKLRWTLTPNSQVVIPTPIVGPDLVYVTGGYMPALPIYAIRPGFTGDISLKAGATTNEAILWGLDRGGVYIPTPVLYRGLLYLLNNTGVLTVYDAQTGEQAYRGRVGAGGAFSASPIAADGRIYYASEDGAVFVTRAGREYVQIARNEMQEPITATPAISDGVMVVRTIGNVYGIGQK